MVREKAVLDIERIKLGGYEEMKEEKVERFFVDKLRGGENM